MRIIQILALILLLSFSSAQTVVIEKEESFASCICYLTANACDPYCCCDSKCMPEDDSKSNADYEESRVDIWKNEGLCLDEGNRPDILSPSECYKVASKGNLSDLKFGLRIFVKMFRSLFCVIKSRHKVPWPFIEDKLEISSEK